MSLEFNANDNFQDLGSLGEFCRNFGTCHIKIKDKTELNICLTIKSNQDIEFILYCSRPLSHILREIKGFPADFDKYRIYRIRANNGRKYIRVSQVINIDVDPNIPEKEYEMQIEKMKGSIRLTYKVDDLINQPPSSYDNLVAF